MFAFLKPDRVRKTDFPSPNFLLYVNNLLRNTPDLAKLEEKKTHMIFLYDDFKKGHRRHEYGHLEHAEYLGQGFTCNCFSMWKQNLGKETFPIAFADKDRIVPFSKIKGELWDVPTETLKFLDKYKQNTVQFQRVRLRVEVGWKNMYLDKDAKVRYISRSHRQVFRPWVYVGVTDYWNELINGMAFGEVSQEQFGEHFYLRHALREAASYYEFKYRDYFEEKPLDVKRKLTPILCDEVGNQYTQEEWDARLKQQQQATKK